MLQGVTAHYLACSTYPLKKGDTCLVHAAAGGVGLLLCQIAKMRGARVIGTVSTEEKAKLARSEEHTSELQSRLHLVCRLLLAKKKESDRMRLSRDGIPSAT